MSKDPKGNPKEYIFFCRRERCINTRPEGLIPDKYDGDKKKKRRNKAHSRKPTQHKAQPKAGEHRRATPSSNSQNLQKQ